MTSRLSAPVFSVWPQWGRSSMPSAPSNGQARVNGSSCGSGSDRCCEELGRVWLPIGAFEVGNLATTLLILRATSSSHPTGTRVEAVLWGVEHGFRPNYHRIDGSQPSRSGDDACSSPRGVAPALGGTYDLAVRSARSRTSWMTSRAERRRGSASSRNRVAAEDRQGGGRVWAFGSEAATPPRPARTSPWTP